MQSNPEKVTGLGGVFFRAKDVATINAWYNKHLGLATTEWGYVFKWMDPNDKDAAVPAGTVWCPFKSDTEYFGPNNKQCMLDYRVKNLPELMKTLTDAGVETVGKIDEYSYGKFGWIMDPEGNKIELWEAKDDGF
ncbi:MAG: VOC family protein [Cyclobacteriaceae bacterium]|nr:VOC family protein [Cyclobacteriaceae bacterium]